jgi:hypothetical protein
VIGRDVVVEELEAILDDADQALTRLQTGESQKGTAALARIRNRARDALRWAGDDAVEAREWAGIA